MFLQKLKKLLYKGGLKLKLIVFVFISILLAISIQSYFIIPFIKKSIEQKAFEVSYTTIDHVSDFSSFALLERTYENRLSLNDAIKKLKDSHLNGLLGVAIYQRQKDQNTSSFHYIAGFGKDIKSLPIEQSLIRKLIKAQNEDISYESYNVPTAKKFIPTYRFVRPILYHYEGKNILLGFTVLYYDKRSITAIIDQVLNYIYTITFAILLLATLYAYFIGSRVTTPILKLTKASTAVTKGELDIHLDIHTNDEIQNLAEHFNIMVAWLKEKNKLQKFVSHSTVNMIQNSTNEPIVSIGEYKELTLLFSDIRNFTALNEIKTPQEVIEIVNFYFTLQAEIIEKNGGDIDKFIGDEIMASFSGADASCRAIESALSIQRAIEKANKERKKKEQIECHVGIGISRGKVIVGNVGYNAHMDYTSIGFAVNMTSRLCSYAKADEILIDKKTFANSGYHCDYNLTEPLTLKGISKNVTAYSITKSES
jgi:class 3 adenylate cyclase/HAMP domain-containing protein